MTDTRANSFGDTATVTYSGLAAGQTYYIRAIAANTGAGSVGSYGLLVNLGTKPLTAIAPPVTVVAEQPNQGGGSIGMDTGSVLDLSDSSLALDGHAKHNQKAEIAAVARADQDQIFHIKIGNLDGEGDVLLVGPSLISKASSEPSDPILANSNALMASDFLFGVLAADMTNPVVTPSRNSHALDVAVDAALDMLAGAD